MQDLQGGRGGGGEWLQPGPRPRAHHLEEPSRRPEGKTDSNNTLKVLSLKIFFLLRKSGHLGQINYLNIDGLNHFFLIS